MQRLNAFRVEAAWKLGRWDDLGKYLKMVQYTLHTIQSDSSPIRSCVCVCVCVYLRTCMCVFVCMCWWHFHDVMQWVLCITSRLALFIPGDVVHWFFMYAWLLWLQEPVTSKNWDVNLGRLLLAAKQKVSLMKIFSCQTGKLFVLYLYDCDFLHFSTVNVIYASTDLSLISRSLSG